MIFFTVRTIREEEGRSPRVYRDTLGNLTVGVGHRVVPADDLELGDEVSDERVEELFWADLRTAERGAKRICKVLGHQPWEVLHALTCMVFQMGYAGTTGFKKTLSALWDKDYELAAKEMLDSRWAREQTPARAARLAALVGDLASEWTSSPAGARVLAHARSSRL